MKKIAKIIFYIFIFQLCWQLQAACQSTDVLGQCPVANIDSPCDITTLYCHGVAGDSTQIKDYKDLMMGKCESINFPDTQKPTGLNLNTMIHVICKKAFGKENINRTQTYLGQGEDIETIRKQIDPDKPYILYGLCRGAAAIINYVATYNPTNVLALVLDEAFANVLDIIDKLIFTNKKGEKILSTPIQREQWLRFAFPSYPKKAKHPVENISAIKNKDLVVFLSYAKDATTFHFPASTWKNYIAFKKAGFKNVYLCELESYGQNAQGTTKLLYLQRLNSVYKKHNLPYKAEYATLTDEQLLELQPSAQEIRKKLNTALKEETIKK
ncbi:MAG: hypothetical protein JO129_01380 [Candidatus Dependentiae bacterium]|nr:hypothetical protein [Candidatus Dependentiae bacterium]